VTGYQKSKCSSKLVAQIITKITNKLYGDSQMRERQRWRWHEIAQMWTHQPKTQTWSL